jgi:hypothetical protein
MQNKTTFLLIIAAIAIAGAAFAFLRIDPQKSAQSTQSQLATYSSSELGVEFQYRPGPTGYVVQEMTPSDPASGLLRSVALVRSEDAQTPPPVGGEGPATITMLVFDNPHKEKPLAWADAHVQYSSINLKQGEVQESVVGGANAIRYMADGLYATDMVVVAHGENVYVFSGAYIDAASDIKKDFSPVISSVKFIPTPGQQTGAPTGKLNINAVCDGALAYMTFPNGADAEKFVADCKEGKHPEVIEKYKADAGLGDGAAI